MIKNRNKIIVEFDDEKEKMLLYEFMEDGTQQIYTEVTLAQLQSSGKDYACSQIGKILLLGLETTRKKIFGTTV